MADRARLAAYRLLRAVDADGAYANLALPGLIANERLDGRDAALATELAYGSVRAAGTLDEIIAPCLTRPLADLEPAARDLLRLGAYQLLRTRIPSHAAVTTTVDLARATGNGRVAGLVNAVLRKVGAADWAGWTQRLGADRSPLGKLALHTAHPEWIAAAFADALGGDLDETEAALIADDERPQTHLVAWPGRVTREALLAAAGGTPGPYSPYAVRLDGGDPGALAAVRERRAGVQDEGSQLCALALAAAAIDGRDERWLDLCAGPGGKTALLAALAADRGATVTANELRPHRADLVCKITRPWDVEVRVGDALDFVDGSVGDPSAAHTNPADEPGADKPGADAPGADDAVGYDRILLDAPCTGLGALRRRPEARWRRDPSDVAQLASLQRTLLAAGLRLLRPGGVLAYVTCSPHPDETTAVVAGHELRDARACFPGVNDLGDGPLVQLWPHRHGTDAMFFALLGAPTA